MSNEGKHWVIDWIAATRWSATGRGNQPLNKYHYLERLMVSDSAVSAYKYWVMWLLQSRTDRRVRQSWAVGWPRCYRPPAGLGLVTRYETIQVIYNSWSRCLMAGRLEKWQFAGRHLRINAIVLGTSAWQALHFWFVWVVQESGEQTDLLLLLRTLHLGFKWFFSSFMFYVPISSEPLTHLTVGTTMKNTLPSLNSSARENWNTEQ